MVGRILAKSLVDAGGIPVAFPRLALEPIQSDDLVGVHRLARWIQPLSRSAAFDRFVTMTSYIARASAAHGRDCLKFKHVYDAVPLLKGITAELGDLQLSHIHDGDVVYVEFYAVRRPGTSVLAFNFSRITRLAEHSTLY
ncbi:hypothetical protein PsYK624_013420 [Phanerochaete sordida]|uniref:Uncharacterized protein n=1 Tax=Phanerochaete sordida TaxID=48140 RepID=A0A9P3FXZ8_9APHY|nr:hypothetical protein PsYK624_013420 [Phanerochaete sordida]